MKKTSIVLAMVLFVLGMNAWAQKVDKWQESVVTTVYQKAEALLRPEIFQGGKIGDAVYEAVRRDLLQITRDVITDLRKSGQKNKEIEGAIPAIVDKVAAAYRAKKETQGKDLFARLRAENPDSYIHRDDQGRCFKINFKPDNTFFGGGAYWDANGQRQDGFHLDGQYILNGDIAIIETVRINMFFFLKEGDRLDLSGSVIASLRKAIEDRLAQLRAENPGAYIYHRDEDGNDYKITFNPDYTYTGEGFWNYRGRNTWRAAKITGSYTLDSTAAIIQTISGNMWKGILEKPGDRIDMDGAYIASLTKAIAERKAAVAAANARGVSAADFDYGLTKDGKGVVITKYKGQATIVNIPAAIEGFPVKELAGAGYTGVFEGNRDITSVTILAGLTSLGNGVFRGCISLTDITLPAGLTEIPQAAFQDCTSLKAIKLPDTVQKIGEGAFKNCASLTALVLPLFKTIGKDPRTSIPYAGIGIGSEAFAGCTSLASITFPLALELGVMGDRAFSGCTALKELTFNGNIGIIGYGAFSGCTALTKVTFNGTIGHEFSGQGLSGGAFRDCINLRELVINGNVGNRLGHGEDPFNGCPLKTVTVGPKVTIIDNVDAFIRKDMPLTMQAALAKFR